MWSVALTLTLGYVHGTRGETARAARASLHSHKSTNRHPHPTAIEAYDLVPLFDCLNSYPDMDAVGTCLDAVNPWVELTKEGKLLFSETATAGFIGGTVGVVGTVIATFIKRDEVKDRLKCSYCEGAGQILCGRCYGTGTHRVADPEAADGWRSEPCPTCEGTGFVVCINCQGSGIAVPEDFLQKLGESEVGFTEEDYIGLFDEVRIPALDLPKPGSSQPIEARATMEGLTAAGRARSHDEDDTPTPPAEAMPQG